jgi:hypothetical protein
MRFSPFALVALTAVLPACAVHDYPIQLPARAPELLPEDVAARFAYTTGLLPTDLETFWEDDEVTVSRGELDVRMLNESEEDRAHIKNYLEALASRDAKRKEEDKHEHDDGEPKPKKVSDDKDAVDPDVTTVAFEYWRSKSAGDAPAPLVIVTPILGGGKELARNNCRDFARAGLHVVLAWRGTKVLHRDWPVELVEVFLRRAVAARGALIDWGLTRAEVDSTRVAAFGISMGGILTSVFVGADARLHSVVIALAGGDLGGIIEVSTEGRLVRFRERKATDMDCTVADVASALRESLISDPLAMARYVDPRKVFLLTTRFDPIVPLGNQERLWEALGQPRRYDIPTGHYTGILYLPYITARIVDWFEQRLQPETAK